MLSQLFVFHKSKNFTSDNEIRMPPTIPINHYFGPRNQQNRTQVLFYYSMLVYSWLKACFEHSNFFTVNVLTTKPTQLRADKFARKKAQDTDADFVRTVSRARGSTTSFLTATTLIYATGAGITAAAGTRLALQWLLDKGFKLFSFQDGHLKSLRSLFFVTTSLSQDWVICAPAAFLGCGSRFSGSLSGIEP